MSVPYHAWTHRPRDLGGTDPIEATEVEQPFVRGVFTGKTLDDGETYSTTGLDGTSQNGYPGILDSLSVNASELFFFNDDEEALWAYGSLGVNSALVIWDLTLKIEALDAFDGDLTAWLKEGKWNGVGLPVASDIQHREILLAANGSWTFRFHGLSWLDVDPNPATFADGALSLSIHVRQDSGSAQTISYGGLLIARLSSESWQP